MLGYYILRCLMMAFGYAYPAFKCFKTVEKNRDDIEELRFWCQYWIILVAVAVFERVADILICWLPLYGELKLAIIIYMWHPKTKGTAVVYNALLRPFITKHENDIDKNLNECKARFWDLSIFCWQNCAGMVQDAFFQLLQELASQTRNFSENSMKESSNPESWPTPSTCLPSSPAPSASPPCSPAPSASPPCSPAPSASPPCSPAPSASPPCSPAPSASPPGSPAPSASPPSSPTPSTLPTAASAGRDLLWKANKDSPRKRRWRFKF